MRRPTAAAALPMRACADCAIALRQDEIAISRRLIGRGIKQFWCIGCLARRLAVPPSVIQRKIEEYRAMGCALFPMKQED